MVDIVLKNQIDTDELFINSSDGKAVLVVLAILSLICLVLSLYNSYLIVKKDRLKSQLHRENFIPESSFSDSKDFSQKEKRINGSDFVVNTTEQEQLDTHIEIPSDYSFCRNTFKNNQALIFFYAFTIFTLVLCIINFFRFTPFLQSFKAVLVIRQSVALMGPWCGFCYLAYCI